MAPSEADTTGSRFWSMADSRTAYELKDIPLLKSIIGVYSRTKSSNAILTVGCSVAERGVELVLETIVVKSGCGEFIDKTASGIISKVKESYPVLQRTPDKIYKKTKSRASRYVRRRTKSALRTCAGYTALSALDALTEASDTAYKHLKHKTNRNKDKNMKTEKHVQTELMSPSKTSRGQQTKLTGADDQWVKKLTHEDERRVERSFSISYIILYPLGLFVRFLKLVQRKLRSLADLSSGTRRSSRRKIEAPPLTPEKVEEIEGRRKVSPRKRLNSSILRNIKSAAFRLIGFDSSCVKQTDIRQFLNCSKHKPLNLSPLMSHDDAEKKRKHDDILSNSEDESDDEDLLNMDLKNYISDEDPDYEPTDEEETDVSIDSEEEEEESDIETVENEGLAMLKDKENLKPTEQKPKEQETKPVDRPKEKDSGQKMQERPKETEQVAEKQKESSKVKGSPKKAVLSPRKQANINNQPALIINKSPQKPFGGKEEKKESNQKPMPCVEQGKQSDGNKTTSQSGGNVEKHHGHKKS